MTKAVLGVGFDGADAERGLDKLDEKLGEVDRATQSLAKRLKAYQELWRSPAGAAGGWSSMERLGASVAKASVDIIKGQVGAVADAVIAPAKTSYAGAIAVANSYRDTTQRIATSTGRNYFEISAQIDSSAKRLGLMPDRVQAYGRSVRGLTDDWGSAMGGLDAFQNRALKTDRAIEDMIPTAVELTNVFGIKSTEQVSRFFGTIDRQAAAAKVSGQQVERVFSDLAGTFGQLSSADPSKLTAMSAALLQGAGGNVGRAERRGAGMMGFLDQHGWWFEQQAKRQGKLKKGESFFDEQGLIKDPNQMIEFAQAEARRVSKGKVTGDVVNYLTAIQGMPREIAAGLMSYKPESVRKLEGATGAASDMVTGFMGTGAGGRLGAEVSKNLADQRFGTGLLGAQDAAVAAGGGSAGIALTASGEIFNKATGVFSDAVNIFAGKAAGGAAGAAVGSGAAGAAGAGGGTAVGAGVLGTAAVPVGLGVAALGVGYGVHYAAGENEKIEAAKAQQRESASLQGFADVKSMNFYRQHFQLPDIAPAVTTTGRADLDHPIRLDQSSVDGIGIAAAKHLQGTTLRTQSIQPVGAQTGMGQPQ